MSRLPLLCSDLRIPAALRESFTEVWQHHTPPRRQPIPLPFAAWRTELKEGSLCIAIGKPGHTALIVTDGRLESTSAQPDSEGDGKFIYQLYVEGLHKHPLLPCPGEDIHISCCGTDSVWSSIVVIALLKELQAPPLHTIATLEEMGMRFVGAFDSQATYWVTARVISVKEEGGYLGIAAAIDTVVWNQAIPSADP
jgi:hypothetical protein